MNTTSKIYMGDDGNYRDKTEQQRREDAELAAAVPGGEPVPFDEEGKIAGEEIVDPDGENGGDTTLGDETAAGGEGGTTEPKLATAKTRKQS